MLASHCPEVDTRWSYECGILKDGAVENVLKPPVAC